MTLNGCVLVRLSYIHIQIFKKKTHDQKLSMLVKVNKIKKHFNLLRKKLVLSHYTVLLFFTTKTFYFDNLMIKYCFFFAPKSSSVLGFKKKLVAFIFQCRNNILVEKKWTGIIENIKHSNYFKYFFDIFIKFYKNNFNLNRFLVYFLFFFYTIVFSRFINLNLLLF